MQPLGSSSREAAGSPAKDGGVFEIKLLKTVLKKLTRRTNENAQNEDEMCSVHPLVHAILRAPPMSVTTEDKFEASDFEGLAWTLCPDVPQITSGPGPVSSPQRIDGCRGYSVMSQACLPPLQL